MIPLRFILYTPQKLKLRIFKLCCMKEINQAKERCGGLMWRLAFKLLITT